MKKIMIIMLIAMTAGLFVSTLNVYAQDDAEETVRAGALEVAEGSEAVREGAAPSGGLFSVVLNSGPLGVLLWLSIFVACGIGVYLMVDCSIMIRLKRIMPQSLIDNVTQSMAEGDVFKALQNCENEPGPMANILIAGFGHVEEGYDVIIEAVSTAADLETEVLMQKVTWLSVVGNLSPMLGLLGTVQGMIGAFASLAGGTPDQGVLALQISQALYTTAAGLTIAVPCVTAYFSFRNVANKMVLRMEAMTMELIKDLRNVEVVEE